MARCKGIDIPAGQRSIPADVLRSQFRRPREFIRRWNSATVTNGAVILTCAMVLVSGTIQLLDRQRAGHTQRSTRGFDGQALGVLSIDRTHVQGSATAAAVLIEVADFQCPFCASYANGTYRSIKEEFVDSGKLQYGFAHLPLANHAFARQAAEALECAGAQGQFWQMHDALFALSGQLATPHIERQAETLKLESKAFRSCLQGVMTVRVERTAAEIRALGVTSTPTFLLGQWRSDQSIAVIARMLGAPSKDSFRSALNDALERTTVSARK
jgi:protein-disulfide isomerase